MQPESQNTISSIPLFKTDQGQIVEYTLERQSTQFSMKVLNIGCTITQVLVRDKNADTRDVILGFQEKTDYIKNPPYFNGVVGRVCGRISNSQFELNEKNYEVTANQGNHHLHGGGVGFSHKVWTSMIYNDGVEFELESEGGEEGYPGAVKVRVRISLLKDRAGYSTEMWAKAEDDTLLALNTHEYWNLSGAMGGNSLSRHNLLIPSHYCLEMNQETLPTGEILKVDNRPALDFRNTPNLLENRLKPDSHWGFMQGYDHSFLINDPALWKELAIESTESNTDPSQKTEKSTKNKNQLKLELNQINQKTGKIERNVATLKSLESGIKMEISSTQKAVHLYTGDYLGKAYGGAEIKGKNGVVYDKNSGICLECQDLPNAVNIERFKSPILRKGEIYHHNIKHIFSVEK